MASDMNTQSKNVPCVMYDCVCAHLLQSCLNPMNCNLWTVTRQAPPSMGFSGQEYWSGLPCSSPGELPNPGIKPVYPMSPALQVESLPLSHL